MDLNHPEHRYRRLGVGSHAQDATGLYLDMVKRAVCNLIYEDTALWRYDQTKKPSVLNRFDLEARVLGEDLPTEAHTMIGWRRLSNIEDCAASIFKEAVPGDFVETGVYRGGSTIFMRAVLKAYGSTDRKVYACDTFVFDPPSNGPTSRAIEFLVAVLMKPAVRIRNQGWRMALYRFLEKQQKSFPRSENPSVDWINAYFYLATHPEVLRILARRDSTSLAAVQSHFARYGLLDDQVVFLKGFFSETLPASGVQAVSMLRCDGDSFESTYGVLADLYDKVSPGGFVIIDDYNSFSDCKQAVDRFRAENHITAPCQSIDNMSMFWRKPRQVSEH